MGQSQNNCRWCKPSAANDDRILISVDLATPATAAGAPSAGSRDSPSGDVPGGTSASVVGGAEDDAELRCYEDRSGTLCEDALVQAAWDARFANGSWERCRLLLGRQDASVNCKDGAGMTALHLFALAGRSQECHELLQRQDFREVNAVDTDGRTALHYAAVFGHAESCISILRLLSIEKIDKKDFWNRTALEQAEMLGRNEAADAIRAAACRAQDEVVTQTADVDACVGADTSLSRSPRSISRDSCDLHESHADAKANGVRSVPARGRGEAALESERGLQPRPSLTATERS